MNGAKGDRNQTATYDDCEAVTLDATTTLKQELEDVRCQLDLLVAARLDAALSGPVRREYARLLAREGWLLAQMPQET